MSIAHWPAWMFNTQCRELRTLGQTSKTDMLPRAPYIAILGDSYGSGQGDWFVENGFNLNSRYQAAHGLQELTGRDVLSLSRAGAGNYDGAAIYAINTCRAIKRLGLDLPDPAIVAVYFYEGNDMSDNLCFKDRYYAPEYDEARIFDDAAFEVFAADMDARFCQGEFRLLQDRSLVGNFLTRPLEGFIYAATKHPRPVPGGGAHTAMVNGQAIPLPDDIGEDDLVRMPPQDKAVGVRFLERSLLRVARFWPQVRRCVVYIPAALSLYRLSGPEGADIRAASEDMERRVRKAAEQHGFEYISTTGALRARAKVALIHGPTDWHHLNRQGYTALGEFLQQRIRID